MTSPGQKTKKKKKRRTPSGSKEYYVREKTGKRNCTVCNKQLHGVPHGKTAAEISRMSKTKKRPSVPFGGVLCTKCRRQVFEEKAKVENGLKNIEDVDLVIKKFIVNAEASK
jgi:ribosomal protein L34E